MGSEMCIRDSYNKYNETLRVLANEKPAAKTKQAMKNHNKAVINVNNQIRIVRSKRLQSLYQPKNFNIFPFEQFKVGTPPHLLLLIIMNGFKEPMKKNI